MLLSIALSLLISCTSTSLHSMNSKPNTIILPPEKILEKAFSSFGFSYFNTITNASKRVAQQKHTPRSLEQLCLDEVNFFKGEMGHLMSFEERYTMVANLNNCLLSAAAAQSNP